MTRCLLSIQILELSVIQAFPKKLEDRNQKWQISKEKKSQKYR